MVKHMTFNCSGGRKQSMRYLIAVAALLTGCASDPVPTDPQEQAALERYMSNCEKLGFVKGTSEHRDCYRRFYQMNIENAPAARP